MEDFTIRRKGCTRIYVKRSFSQTPKVLDFPLYNQFSPKCRDKSRTTEEKDGRQGVDVVFLSDGPNSLFRRPFFSPGQERQCGCEGIISFSCRHKVLFTNFFLGVSGQHSVNKYRPELSEVNSPGG